MSDSAGRLIARPVPDATREERPRTGTMLLGLGRERDAILFVPRTYRHDTPVPLVVMLHGAGGAAKNTLAAIQQLAETIGVAMLVPDSRGDSWDVILRAFGPDVAFIDRALAWTFARYAIHPNRIGIGGFSDGASYALSLGITNGDLFGAILAFSPGFAQPADQIGMPRIFISHGTRDRVLPIDRCSRRLVPALRQAGYAVVYREFDGPHTVPESIRREALQLFLKWSAS